MISTIVIKFSNVFSGNKPLSLKTSNENSDTSLRFITIVQVNSCLPREKPSGGEEFNESHFGSSSCLGVFLTRFAINA